MAKETLREVLGSYTTVYQTEYYKVLEVPVEAGRYIYQVRVRSTNFSIGASAKLQNAINAACELQKQVDKERKQWELKQTAININY